MPQIIPNHKLKSKVKMANSIKKLTLWWPPEECPSCWCRSRRGSSSIRSGRPPGSSWRSRQSLRNSWQHWWRWIAASRARSGSDRRGGRRKGRRRGRRRRGWALASEGPTEGHPARPSGLRSESPRVFRRSKRISGESPWRRRGERENTLQER